MITGCTIGQRFEEVHAQQARYGRNSIHIHANYTERVNQIEAIIIIINLIVLHMVLLHANSDSLMQNAVPRGLLHCQKGCLATMEQMWVYLPDRLALDLW